MRDLPGTSELLVLARQTLLDELAPLLPPERRRDAHLVATVMAMALREAGGVAWPNGVAAALAELYGEPPEAGKPQRDGPPFAPREPAGPLLTRFAADLRNGAFETSPSRSAASRAILWRLTVEKLREANPHFLSANGLDDISGTET